jgi:perosamine synthetase
MIYQIQPWIDNAELEELKEIIKTEWITEGKKTQLFEEKIKELTGAKYAISMCNGTVALYVSLKALGIGRGDEVIVPDLTFIATPNSVKMADAEPVLCDINPQTFNIDVDKIEQHITSKTKAIMPVHLYGQSAEMDKIIDIAKKHGLFVIEDAAQGVGVKFNNKHVGTFGNLGILSFYGNKTITTAEGGMILTDNPELFKRCWQLKNHGREIKGTFIHPHIGFNFCFTDVQAAIGLAQLGKLNKIIELKAQIRNTYMNLLKDIPQIEFPYVDARCEPVFWFTNILIDEPQKLADYLLDNDIQTRRFFYPIHLQPCYNIKGDFYNAEWVYNKGLSLPSSALLKEEEIKIISNKIKEFYSLQ